MPQPKKKSVNPVNAAKGKVAVNKYYVDYIKGTKKIASDEVTKNKKIQSKLNLKQKKKKELLGASDVKKFNVAGTKITKAKSTVDKATKIMPKYMSKYSDAVRTLGRVKLTNNKKKSNKK